MYTTEAEVEVVGLGLGLNSQFWIDFTEKHMLTDDSIYLRMSGHLRIHRTFCSFSKLLDTIPTIGASLV